MIWKLSLFAQLLSHSWMQLVFFFCNFQFENANELPILHLGPPLLPGSFEAAGGIAHVCCLSNTVRNERYTLIKLRTLLNWFSVRRKSNPLSRFSFYFDDIPDKRLCINNWHNSIFYYFIPSKAKRPLRRKALQGVKVNEKTLGRSKQI